MARIRTRYGIPKKEDAFEIVCLKLLRRKWNAPGLAQYGKRGQRQHGIDLIDIGAQQPVRAAQCKLHEAHKAILPIEIEAEVEKAKGAPFKLDVFAIATTAKPSTEAQRKVLEINQKHRGEGLFLVELLHWRELEDLLDEYADVREDVYGGLDAEQVARISGQLREVKEAVEQVVTSTSDRFKSILQEAKQAIDEYDYPVAKRLLERLRGQRWDDLTSTERFQLLTRLAVVRLGESVPGDAAELFLKAKPYQPHDEKALTNETLAYFLRGELLRAHQLATRLRERFPNSVQLAALWVNSAASDANPDDLIRELDPYLLPEAEVAVALAVRLAQKGDTERAESLLKGVKRGKTEWSTLHLLTARAIVALELKAASKVGQRDQANREMRLHEAEELFSHAAELGKTERQTHVVAEAFVDRAQVRRLLGQESAADQDIEQAFSIAPDEPTVIGQMAELQRKRGNADQAVDMMNRANQLSPRIDIQYTLASALRARGKPGDYAKAAEIMHRVALATPDPTIFPGGREHAISIAIDCLGRENRWGDAKNLLSSLPKGFIEPVAAASMRASLALQQKEYQSANQYADESLSLLTEDTDRDAVAYLAGLLNDLGRHKEALPLWQRVVRPGEPGPDPRRLLDTAYRLGRHDVILTTCERFRNAGVRDPRLLQYEVAVLEEYDVESTIRAIQEHLRDRPDDRLMRLRLSTLGIRLNRSDIVDAEPSHMPPVENVDPAVGLAAVRVMKLSGHPDAALLYGYELLRRYFDAPEAHRAYTLALLPLGPKPTIQEFETSEAGTAVCYVEENTVDQHWIVIEDPPAGAPRFNDEIPVSSNLARELACKRVGDSFTLAPSSISPRMATVTQILNKYIYRYQDCMGQWQIRFPEAPDVQSVHLKRQASGEELDISGILKSIDRLHEASQEMEQMYRSRPVPIHMFAAQLGKDALQGVYYLASKADSTLFCCTGTKEERDAAFEATEVSTGFVLDLTAIATLMILESTDVLRVLPVSLIVSQSTMGVLQDLLSEQQVNTAEGGVLGKTDSGYAFVEHTEERRQARMSALSGMIELLRTVAKVVPCRELAGFDAERRDTLDKAFGRYGAEAIVLAATPGHVLWTDDHRQAGFAMTEHGVRRTWTQAILQFGVKRGSVTSEQYLDASAKLLGFGYVFTSSNPQVLLRAGALAEWSPDRWPLKQALDQFKAEYIDLIGQLQLATLFMTQLYREPIPGDLRDQVLFRILDLLATRPDGLAGIQAIQQTVPRVSGLNVVGARDAAKCIERWLDARSLKLILP
jgi:tetratricopeptide (TPR) repeat protein